MKMLFQALCLETTSWDKELPLEFKKKWEATVDELQYSQ